MQENQLLDVFHLFVHRQPQRAEDGRNHFGPDDLVAVKGPTGLGVESFRTRLAYVVQQGGPPQPQVVAATGDVVEDFQRVDEIVFVRPSSDSLDAFEPGEFRENQRKKPRAVEQIEPDGRHGREHDLVQFRGDPLFRYDSDPLLVAPDRVERFGVDVEAELGGETHRPDHPQRIVRERDVRIAGSADQPALQIARAVERIYQLAERRRVQGKSHRVDREVPAELVVLDRAVLDDRLARVGPVRLLARSDELHFPRSAAQHGRAEVLEHRHAAARTAAHRFGHLDSAACDDDVDVGARPMQEPVAHVAADDECLHAFRIGDFADAAEKRVSEGCVHRASAFSCLR